MDRCNRDFWDTLRIFDSALPTFSHQNPERPVVDFVVGVVFLLPLMCLNSAKIERKSREKSFLISSETRYFFCFQDFPKLQKKTDFLRFLNFKCNFSNFLDGFSFGNILRWLKIAKKSLPKLLRSIIISWIQQLYFTKCHSHSFQLLFLCISSFQPIHFSSAAMSLFVSNERKKMKITYIS